jgi:hypothetical protein
MATRTTVIVLCDEAVLIWAIPPLSPQPPDFSDHNPTHMPPPLFTIPFSDIPHHPARIRWNTISSWYFGSSRPLYFDMLCQNSKLHRFKITLKPDLSTASLHVVNTSELTPYDFDYVSFEDYRICEDTLVSCWTHHDYRYRWIKYQWGVYTGTTSARLANVTSNGGPAAKMLLPHSLCKHPRVIGIYLCPASCRFVILDSSSVVVSDIF